MDGQGANRQGMKNSFGLGRHVRTETGGRPIQGSRGHGKPIPGFCAESLPLIGRKGRDGPTKCSDVNK